MYISLGPTSIATAVADNSTEEYSFDYFASTSSESRENWLEQALKKIDATEVRVGYSTQKMTLVPNEAFAVNDAQKYAQTSFPTDQPESICIDSIVNQQAINIYAANTNDWSKYISRDKKSKFCHRMSPLIALTTVEEENRVWAFIDEDSIAVVAYQDGQLKLAKDFDVTSVDDVLYYVLLAYHYAQLNPMLDELKLAGRVRTGSAIHNKLATYCSHIKFARVPHVEEEQSHLFYDIYLLTKYI